MAKRKNNFLGENQKKGFLLLIVAVVLWVFKPQDPGCSKWYDVFCQVGSFFNAPIYGSIEFVFMGLSLLLVAVGVLYLIDIDVKKIIELFL